jgi:hypothetical protein
MRTLASHNEVFPIRDRSSAELMSVKATLLNKAGIISEFERFLVLSRARPYLAPRREPSPTEHAPRVAAGR